MRDNTFIDEKIVTIQNICPKIYKNTGKNMAVCLKISNISWPKEKMKHNFHLEFCIQQYNSIINNLNLKKWYVTSLASALFVILLLPTS